MWLVFIWFFDFVILFDKVLFVIGGYVFVWVVCFIEFNEVSVIRLLISGNRSKSNSRRVVFGIILFLLIEVMS